MPKTRKQDSVFHRNLQAYSRKMILKALKLTGNNQVKASLMLGISRGNLRTILKDYRGVARNGEIRIEPENIGETNNVN